jgi:hypothetical protein
MKHVDQRSRLIVQAFVLPRAVAMRIGFAHCKPTSTTTGD